MIKLMYHNIMLNYYSQIFRQKKQSNILLNKFTFSKGLTDEHKTTFTMDFQNSWHYLPMAILIVHKEFYKTLTQKKFMKADYAYRFINSVINEFQRIIIGL